MPKIAGGHRLVTLIGSSGNVLHDNLTDYPIITDAAHHKVHEGDMYQYSEVFSLGTGGQKLFHLVTPDTTTWTHLNLTGLMTARGADSNVSIYHSSAVSSVGDGVVLANENANSAITHTVSVYQNPTTITATGTLLHREWVASGAQSGGVTFTFNEVILKQNASHLLIFESEGNNNSIGAIIQFYDHTNV
jgi:hypothetical protein